MHPEDEDVDEDEDEDEDLDDEEDLDAEDEEDAKAILGALMESFEETSEGVDLLVAQQAVLTFAIAVTHSLLYDVAEVAEGVDLDIQRLLEEWLIDACRMFTDGVGNERLLREVGRIMERPELNLRFNRQFRRRLAGR